MILVIGKMKCLLGPNIATCISLWNTWKSLLLFWQANALRCGIVRMFHNYVGGSFAQWPKKLSLEVLTALSSEPIRCSIKVSRLRVTYLPAKRIPFRSQSKMDGSIVLLPLSKKNSIFSWRPKYNRKRAPFGGFTSRPPFFSEGHMRRPRTNSAHVVTIHVWKNTLKQESAARDLQSAVQGALVSEWTKVCVGTTSFPEEEDWFPFQGIRFRRTHVALTGHLQMHPAISWHISMQESMLVCGSQKCYHTSALRVRVCTRLLTSQGQDSFSLFWALKQAKQPKNVCKARMPWVRPTTESQLSWAVAIPEATVAVVRR